MQLTSLLPVVAAIALFLFGLSIIYRNGPPKKYVWLFPMALSIFFFLFSLQAGMAEGALGFWTEHTRNLWGNQIWFDLLFVAGIGWFFAAPQAKAHGMKLLPWFLFILLTGSIGFLAMVARLLYLRERAAGRSA